MPQAIRAVVCGIATSVHGGDPPVNALTIMATLPVATAIRVKTPDAENALLTLLDSWITQRGVRVARLEVFYGRAHLATASTGVFGAPTVEFH